MPTGRDPLVSDHHCDRVVEAKRDDCGPPAGSAADDSRGIVAPSKMPRPSLQARIEQSYLFTGERIESASLRLLEAVAHSTRKAEVLFIICSAGCLRNNVINFKLAKNIALSTVAVLAAMLCPLTNASINLSGRHT